MATSFSEIYCLNKTIKKDSKYNKASDYMINFVMFNYLKMGLGFLYTMVSNDSSSFIDKLKDLTEPTEIEYNFISDGTSTQYQLTPPPPTDFNIYAGVLGEDGIYTEVTNYTVDTVNYKVDFDEPFLLDKQIKIVAYTIGQFNQDLDYDLRMICAEAMNIPFLEENQNNRDILQQLVYSNSWRIFSQNDHLRGVNFVVRDQRDYVDTLIVNYSFSNTKERMLGLIGKSGF